MRVKRVDRKCVECDSQLNLEWEDWGIAAEAGDGYWLCQRCAEERWNPGVGCLALSILAICALFWAVVHMLEGSVPL